MNKLTTGLASLVLALGAGCAAQQPRTYVQPQAPKGVEITEDYLTLADASRVKMSEDKKYTPEELSAVIDQYQVLKASKAEHAVKEHYKKTVADYEKIINDAFNEAQIFAYVGYAGDKAVEHRPSNLGGVNPLYVAKGKAVAGNFSVDEKAAILSRSRSAWLPYKVKHGSINPADVFSTAIRVDSNKFAQMLKDCKVFGFKDVAGYDYLDGAKWKTLNDGNYDNGEVRNGNLFVSAVYTGHEAK